MIQVYILGEKEPHTFQTPYNALRFMYAMKGKGYLIQGWRCEDPQDHLWIERRFKQ